MKDGEMKLTKRQEELLTKMYYLKRTLSSEEVTEEEKDDLSVLLEHGYVERTDTPEQVQP